MSREPRPRFRRALLTTIVGLALSVVTTTTSAQAATSTRATARAPETITTSDGVSLAAYLWTPAGSGYPLIVMPAPWGGDRNAYDTTAQNFANAGYAVLTYAERGFGSSTGTMDIAGTASQSDVSTVISWGLGHTAASSAKIGLVGMSYGAGVGMMAAAKDSRIRVVVALSVWADYAGAMDPNKALKLTILKSLMSTATRVTSEAQDLKNVLTGNVSSVPTLLSQLAPTRSPARVVSALNANNPAILIVNGMQDSLFPADQVGSMFSSLTTPKRLILLPGDHAAPMEPVAFASGGAWTSISDWLAHYLGGISNHANSAAQVTLTDNANGSMHGYSSWTAAQQATTLRLGAVTTTTAGTLGAASSNTWTRTLATGYATGADSGAQQLSTTTNYVAPQVNMTSVGTTHAWMWNGASNSSSTLVSGMPTVHLMFTPSSSAATVFAYLYDVSSNGVGTLMSAQPYSLTGQQSGVAKAIDFSMQPVSRTLAAGHHLTLVIDTVDARYLSNNAAGTTIGLGSSTSNPSSLSFTAN